MCVYESSWLQFSCLAWVSLMVSELLLFPASTMLPPGVSAWPSTKVSHRTFPAFQVLLLRNSPDQSEELLCDSVAERC